MEEAKRQSLKSIVVSVARAIGIVFIVGLGAIAVALVFAVAALAIPIGKVHRLIWKEKVDHENNGPMCPACSTDSGRGMWPNMEHGIKTCAACAREFKVEFKPTK